jgi:hypothetical protein
MSSPESGIGRGILLKNGRRITADSIRGDARQPQDNNACKKPVDYSGDLSEKWMIAIVIVFQKIVYEYAWLPGCRRPCLEKRR